MSDELNAKLLRLTKLQDEIDEARRNAAKDYRDQLKDIREEIKETVESLDDSSF